MVERLPLPYGAGFAAGRPFLRYRRASRVRATPLPDFYIRAHAAADDVTLITTERTPAAIARTSRP